MCFLTELTTLHIDQLAAARLDTETAMLDLDNAHSAELDEVSRCHSGTVTQLTADLAKVTADLAAATASRDEDATEFTVQREQVGGHSVLLTIVARGFFFFPINLILFYFLSNQKVLSD